MDNIIVVAIIVSIGWIIGLLFERKRRKMLQRFWKRSCTGVLWRRRFPSVQKQAIREFLDAFVDSFGFNAQKKLKFTPDDKIVDIYNALYPYKGLPDALEIAMLAINLEKRYGFDGAKVENNDITLGQLFALTMHPSN